MMSYSVLLCVVAALAAVSATDYCKQKICQEDDIHVACGHSGKFNVSCPADAKMAPITDDLKKVLVDAHNDKRNFIAGGGHAKHSPACRMATMEWDDELASLAALRVKSCYMAHDSCLFTDAFDYVGQSLALKGFYDPVDYADQFKDAVEHWYGEVKYSKQAYIDTYPEYYTGPAIGHFTVMMSDRNNRVGCAASTYSVKGQPYKLHYLACNYATTNMIGFPIYAKCNKPAFSCTTGKNPQYPNLCSPSELYDINKWY